MSLADKNPLIDLFFDPVINCESHEALRIWLKKQKTEDIRTFLDTFNFSNSRSQESILTQELETREASRNRKEKWLDRIIGFITGIASTLLIGALSN